jgi:hypothetical protein
MRNAAFGRSARQKNHLLVLLNVSQSSCFTGVLVEPYQKSYFVPTSVYAGRKNARNSKFIRACEQQYVR